MNPHQILQIKPGSDKNTIKKAYHRLARIYHPSKGGSKDQFLLLKKAYKQLMALDTDDKETTNDFKSLKGGFDQFARRQEQRADPTLLQGFTSDRFNTQFQQSRGDTDMVYDVNLSDFKERTKSDFHRANAEIDRETSNIKRMFSRGQFDSNAFNHLFNHIKQEQQSQEIQEYQEPEPTPIGHGAAFTMVDDHGRETGETRGLTQLNYSNYDRKDPHNPRSVDPRVIDHMRQKNDITRENAMTGEQIKQKMSQYQNFDPYQNRPDQQGPVGDSIRGSVGGDPLKKETKYEQARRQMSGNEFQQRLQERQLEVYEPPYQVMQYPQQNNPIIDNSHQRPTQFNQYPISSHTVHEREFTPQMNNVHHPPTILNRPDSSASVMHHLQQEINAIKSALQQVSNQSYVTVEEVQNDPTIEQQKEEISQLRKTVEMQHRLLNKLAHRKQ